MSAAQDAYYATRPKTHFVYRAFDAAGDALYVGCTVNPKRRLAEHRRSSEWWPFAVRFEIDTEPQPDGPAWATERFEIRRLRPAFNLGANHEHYLGWRYVQMQAKSA